MTGATQRITGRQRNRPAAQAARWHALTVDIDGAAPTEIRIFRPGANDTTKGTFHFTPRSAELVMKAAEDWGNEYSFDYEHAALQPVDNGPVPAAGWFRLELRDTPDGPELWAVDIRWTDRARELIEAKEVRYISPAFTTDSQGEITSLINIALTNLPATKRLEPLVAARLVALGASISIDEVLDQLRAQLAPSHAHLADAWPVDVYLDKVVLEAGDGRTYAVPFTVDADAGRVSLAGDPIEVTREWIPLERGAQEAPSEGSQHMKLNPAALIALGLAADAGAEQVAAAVERAAETMQALSRLVPEGQDVVGTVAAWRDAAQRVEALAQRVEELEREKAQRELEAILDEAIKQGKVTPAQREALAQMFTSDRGVNLEGLRAYVAASPRIVALTGAGAKREPVVTTSAAGAAVAVDVTGKRWEDLSNVEKHNLRVTDPETFEALYREHRKRQAN